MGHGGVTTEAEARARTGHKQVGRKWIDTNKGSAEAPRYRSRLVCTEVRHKGVEPIVSATLPLETLRVLLIVACQEDFFRVEDPFSMFIADVSRAHSHADAVRDVYVRLPDEDPKAKQPGVCGKFRKTMHSSLDAAQRWGERTLGSGLGSGRIFPRRGFSVPLLPQKVCKPTFWCTLTIFHSGPLWKAKACTEFATNCIRTEQSCNAGPRAVAVTNSEFHG